MSRILSIDIPWGGEHYVGATLAELQGAELLVSPQVVVVDTAVRDHFGAVPEFPADEPEVAGFITNGCGDDRALPVDLGGPFLPGFPVTPQSRAAYLKSIWRAFNLIRQLLRFDSIDLVLVDVPLVSEQLIQCVLANNWDFAFRPVERAFLAKVMIPGTSPSRPDGMIQFARFQPGILPGCRPGYAICVLARLAFNAAMAAESFPQLSIGALAEYSAAEENLPLLPRLAAHKNGNAQSRAAAQAILTAQFQNFFAGLLPNWMQPNIPSRAKPDGYDSLLGLLPGIVRLGYQAPVAGPWNESVLLLNHVAGHPPFPQATGAGRPLIGAEPWMGVNLQQQIGTDHRGILTCRLALWG